MTKKTYDLFIIGGGITGAGTALDAASRGMKVALSCLPAYDPVPNLKIGDSSLRFLLVVTV
jgi:tRNA U34 5-carboxymethylaminomethyl modifying enzyme MnmG/GidA